MANYQSNRTARGHRRRRLVTLRRQMDTRFRRTLRRGVFRLILQRIRAMPELGEVALITYAQMEIERREVRL